MHIYILRRQISRHFTPIIMVEYCNTPNLLSLVLFVNLIADRNIRELFTFKINTY